jgi:hypothetical protein
MIILGFSSIHYETERLNDVIDGSNTRPDFRRYDDVDAATDLKTAYFYDELLIAYAACRCVPTIRNEDACWQSIRYHVNERYPRRWKRTKPIYHVNPGELECQAEQNLSYSQAVSMSLHYPWP